jgi:hypothetical protein
MDEQSILFKLQLTGTEWARFNPTRSCRAHKTGKSRLPRSRLWEISISCRLIIVLFQEVSPKAVEKPLFVAWPGLPSARRQPAADSGAAFTHTPEMNVRGAILNFNQA